MKSRFTLLITKESRWYVARCVELGVVSQGKTIEKVRENLVEAVELFLEGQPRRFWTNSSQEGAPLVSTLEITHA